jgi:hypothetical protein
MRILELDLMGLRRNARFDALWEGKLVHCLDFITSRWVKTFYGRALRLKAATDLSWTAASQTQHKQLILSLLEGLETRDAEQRFNAARAVCYIAQGTPHETESSEDHLQRILTNCMLLRACGTLQVVYDALRAAGGRWTIVSCVSAHLYFTRMK